MYYNQRLTKLLIYNCIFKVVIYIYICIQCKCCTSSYTVYTVHCKVYIIPYTLYTADSAATRAHDSSTYMRTQPPDALTPRSGVLPHCNLMHRAITVCLVST